jgi:hypothetical protein
MSGRGDRTPRRAAAGLAAGLVAALLTGCGSARHDTSAVVSASPTSALPGRAASTVPPATPTTVAGQVPTAPNCGGGAYRPTTLLIVCASGAAAVMATGVTWRFWGSAAAEGSGTVHMVVHGQPTARPARLTLTGATRGPVGPQFLQLTVTWIGASPTGRPEALFHLQPGA